MARHPPGSIFPPGPARLLAPSKHQFTATMTRRNSRLEPYSASEATPSMLPPNCSGGPPTRGRNTVKTPIKRLKRSHKITFLGPMRKQRAADHPEADLMNPRSLTSPTDRRDPEGLENPHALTDLLDPLTHSGAGITAERE